MQAPTPGSFDRPLRVAVMTSLFTIGPLAFLIMPALLAGLADKFHWSEAELGQLATIELSGMAVTSWSGLYWQKRWNWRVLALIGVALLVAGNTGGAMLDAFATLAAARFAAGFGGGILVALYFAYLPGTSRPDRNGSIATFVQVAATVVIYYVASAILARWGLSGLYGLIALAALGVLPFIGVIPKHPPILGEETAAATTRPAAMRALAILGLCAGTALYVSQAGILSFMADVGQQIAGLPVDDAFAAIGLSAVAGLLGPAASYWLSQRAGFLIPIAGSCAAQAVLFFLLGRGGYGYVGFLVILSGLQIAWNFVLPYLFAVMVVVDEALVVAVPGAQAIGIALGPIVIGSAIERYGAGGGVTVAAAALGLSFAMVVPMCVRAKRAG